MPRSPRGLTGTLNRAADQPSLGVEAGRCESHLAPSLNSIGGVGSIDLDLAVGEIEHRVGSWRTRGFDVAPVTWREQGEGWPPSLKTERGNVVRPDSIGVAVRRGEQEGSVVLFDGGWCDLLYWVGGTDAEPVYGHPGYPSGLTVEQFGLVLDDFIGRFGAAALGEAAGPAAAHLVLMPTTAGNLARSACASPRLRASAPLLRASSSAEMPLCLRSGSAPLETRRAGDQVMARILQEGLNRSSYRISAVPSSWRGRAGARWRVLVRAACAGGETDGLVLGENAGERGVRGRPDPTIEDGKHDPVEPATASRDLRFHCSLVRVVAAANRRLPEQRRNKMVSPLVLRTDSVRLGPGCPRWRRKRRAIRLTGSRHPRR
jgi:hypothetical protein